MYRRFIKRVQGMWRGRMRQEKIKEMEELLYQKFRGVELEAVKEFVEELKEKALSHCRIINCYELKFIETTIDDLLYDWQGHPPVCKCELKIDELLEEYEK